MTATDISRPIRSSAGSHFLSTTSDKLLPAAVRELVINDEHLFTGLLLDASYPDVNQHVTIEHQTRIQIEAITRDYVYALHISRTALVKVAES